MRGRLRAALQVRENSRFLDQEKSQACVLPAAAEAQGQKTDRAMPYAARCCHGTTCYAAACLGCASGHTLTGLRRPMDGTFDRMRSGRCSWKHKGS